GHGTWVLGAPEIALASSQDGLLPRAADLAATGQRVLALAHTTGPLDGQALPQGLRAVAFIVLSERLRADIAETIGYFAAQGVTLKVISGDSPRTVSAVASRAGVPHAGDPVDARDLPDDSGPLGAALEGHSVFGRVTPHQKQAMVHALQARGHTVAMTGDGVNDVLALKLADIGVAMGSGAPATRAVAELVLLDNDFATLPGVVAEGRRVTANIERVANLFITKTVWATLLAVAAGAALLPYPFPPPHPPLTRHLALGGPPLLPPPRPAPPPLPAGVRRPGATVRRSRGAHHRRGHLLGLCPRTSERPPPGRTAHRRHFGRAPAQPVRARPAG